MENKPLIQQLEKLLALEVYSEKCIKLFEKCLDVFHRKMQVHQSSQNNLKQKIACGIENFDNYQMQLNIICYPNIGFGEELLPSKDDKLFFNKPLFLPLQKQEEVTKTLAEKFQIEEDLYFDEIYPPMENIVNKWLCNCWQQANRKKKMDYPMYLIHHSTSYSNVKNLLDEKYYDLEN